MLSGHRAFKKHPVSGVIYGYIAGVINHDADTALHLHCITKHRKHTHPGTTAGDGLSCNDLAKKRNNRSWKIPLNEVYKYKCIVV